MEMEMPTQGGSYQRDPKTGKLKRLEDDTASDVASPPVAKDKETGK